jgi:hypothetical protein
MRARIVAFLLLLTAPAAAAPKAEPWPRWERHDPAATVEIDHRPWHEFLQTHVVASSDGINRVPYGRIPRTQKEALDAYVARLAATPISHFAQPEQAAYWINLYNALTVKVVLDHYPIASIREIRISPGLFSVGPWGKKLIAVEGESLSLDDIEHRILRPVWRDPRLHYTVNCASLGCPNLAREAYTRANLEALLEAGARAYVNHPRGARLDGGRLTVSSIYVWFQEDFGGSDAGVVAHLRRYAAMPLAAPLADAARIAGHDYDWALNDAR